MNIYYDSEKKTHFIFKRTLFLTMSGLVLFAPVSLFSLCFPSSLNWSKEQFYIEY